ncbi:MAG TPA: DegT/DnrJ/EryC1/StrS family aminotransferase [Terriglobales bacterium]|nr:DegT/DnrJ/EryC1/StrS family aminotransferase [Terriglobales bacterium]
MSKITLNVVTKGTGSAVAPLFPFLDLKAQFEQIKAEVLEAITRTLHSQRFILGPEVEQFEAEVGRYVGSPHAISCASGSDALLLALMALGVGPGDEVITTPFTFIASASCIARLGAKPIFADIDPETYNLDPADVERVIGKKCRAMIPVHLYGLPAAMPRLLEIAKQNGTAVIEDAAQALGSEYNGSKVGNMGNIGCFSFFPSKNLGGAGDGGLMTTHDPDMADRLRVLRAHGSRRKYHCDLLGINSRLDALQAAILRVKLPYLEKWTEKRQQNADRYRALFREFGLEKRVILPKAPGGLRHVYNQFVVRVQQRDGLRSHLQRFGIPTEIYYPEPLHLQPAFAYLGYNKGDFPHAEAACQEVLALPIYPELEEHHQIAVVSAVADFYESH